MKKYFFFILLVFFASCKKPEHGKNDSVAISVNSKSLSYSDLSLILPKTYTQEDSLRIVNNYIDKWIKTQLLLEHANMNLTEEQKNVKRQIEDYKNSLLIYKYQQQYISQKLDTFVNYTEIKKYYEKHHDDFILNEHLIKGIFIKILLEAPHQDTIRSLCFSKKVEDIKQLESYCFKYAEKHEYFENRWKEFASVVAQIPVKIDDAKMYLKTNKYLETTDNKYRYYLYIDDYKIQGDVSPLTYIQQRIKSIIINKRKLSIIKTLENEVYEEALSRENIKKYNND